MKELRVRIILGTMVGLFSLILLSACSLGTKSGLNENIDLQNMDKGEMGQSINSNTTMDFSVRRKNNEILKVSHLNVEKKEFLIFLPVPLTLSVPNSIKLQLKMNERWVNSKLRNQSAVFDYIKYVNYLIKKGEKLFLPLL